MKPCRRQEELADSRCAPRCLDDVVLSVLFKDDHFCVIDKPPDVRMDGDFDVTVEKIMQRKLAGVPGVDVNNLKWIHQLDFATSGVLCVGLTRAGAAAASSCFEHREVEKCYLAVVSGHLSFDSWPVAPFETQEEIKAPFKKRRVCKDLQLQETWQQQVMKANLDALWTALKNVDTTAPMDDETRASFIRMKGLTIEELTKGPKLRKELRKLLKNFGVTVELIESSHAEAQNTLAVAGSNDADEAQSAASGALESDKLAEVIASYRTRDPPAIFRVEGDEGTLIVRIPVAEVAGDFRMEPGHAANPGKPSETAVTILQRGTYQGQPVTKVLLHPHTGRRHQLRVHTLCLGHPIVGDYTYNAAHHDAVDRLLESQGQNAEPVPERMMLHAYRLRIPFPSGGKFPEELRAKLSVVGETSTIMVSAEAPDPFEQIVGQCTVAVGAGCA